MCPLSLKQVGANELSSLIERGLSGVENLTEAFAKKGRKEELIAVGYSYEQEMGAVVDEVEVSWREQRVVVRSEGFARQQAAFLDHKIKRAKATLLALNERKRGKKRLTKEALEAAVAGVLAKEGVAGLLRVEVVTKSSKQVTDSGSEQPSRTAPEEETIVLVEVAEAAVKARKERVGWRV